MSRNQIILIALCAVLGAGIYLFSDTKKPKDKEAVPAGPEAMQQQAPTQEVLNIEEYIADVSGKISDKATSDKIQALLAAGKYKELIQEYQKLDKPLAIAYYAVKLAESEKKPESFVGAGDYSSMLMQSAPDAKAKNYLSANAINCFQKAVDLDSGNTDYKIRLAGAFMESGSAPMQGVTILLDIVKQDSSNTDALLMLGRFGIISGQYDKAIARLEKILYLHPQNSEALLLMAEAYNGQGNKTKAIELLERCKKTVTNPDAKKEIDNYIESIKKPNS